MATTTAMHVLAAARRSRGRDLRRAAATGVGQACTDLGPTFVKLGQMISANPAIFPDFVVEAFRHNQDRCRPVAIEEVRRTVEAELGAPLEEIFTRFDPVPLAAGSIAQVHDATLADGRRVAVKVRRPGLVELLGQDLALLRAALRIALRVKPKYGVANPLGVVDDFEITLSEELAFSVEARRMEELREVFASWPIAIPVVVPEYTGDHVLTMSYMEGVKIDDLAGLRAKGHDPAPLADLLISSLLYSALHRGIFHGDGHPGNLVVLDDGRLGMYDFGIVGRLEDDDRKEVSRFFRGLVLQDFAIMADSLTTLTHLPPDDLDVTIATMAELTGVLAGPDGSFRLTELDPVSMLPMLLAMANDRGLVIPDGMILLFKQLLYLNGLAAVLDPALNVFEGGRFFPYFAPDDGMADPADTLPSRLVGEADLEQR